MKANVLRLHWPVLAIVAAVAASAFAMAGQFALAYILVRERIVGRIHLLWATQRASSALHEVR